MATTLEKFDKWYKKQEREGLSWADGLPHCPGQLEEKEIIRYRRRVRWHLRWIRVGFLRVPRWLPEVTKIPVSVKVLTNPNPKTWKNPHRFSSKYHPGAVYEMRSKPIANGAGQQCCYDSGRNLLTDHNGAGTPDKKSPVWWKIWEHLSADVWPFDWAYKLDGNRFGKYVDMYLEVRPPDRGETAPTEKAEILVKEQAPRVTVPQPAPTPTPIGASNVQITDIFYDGLVPLVESDEYVEITNSGDAPQDLTGWVLKDIAEGYPSFTFPHYILELGATIRVYTNEIHPEWGGFSFGYGRAIWNNREPDVAALYDAQGKEISRQSYSV